MMYRCTGQSSLHTYHSISHSQLPQWKCTARRLLPPKHCDSRPPSQLIIRFAWCLCRVFRRPCDGRTTIFVLTSVVQLTISLLGQVIVENIGEPGCPHYPDKRGFQINTCKKEGELGSFCACALPRTEVRCPFRHGPPMNAKRPHCPTGVTVLTGPVRQAFSVTCKCS